MSEDWLDYLRKVWAKSLKAKNVGALSMLLRDFVSYGKQSESIDEAFAQDILQRIEVLEKLRPRMNPSDVSRALRAILYAKRHTQEISTDYGSGFRTVQGRGNHASDRDSDVFRAPNASGQRTGNGVYRSGNGLQPSDLDDDHAEMD